MSVEKLYVMLSRFDLIPSVQSHPCGCSNQDGQHQVGSRLHLQGKARSFSSFPIGLLLIPRQVYAHKPKSREGFPNSISPKLKLMLSDVRWSLSIRSSTPDADQKVDFYTCEQKLVIHGLLMAVDFPSDRFVPFVQAPIDLHGSMS